VPVETTGKPSSDVHGSIICLGPDVANLVVPMEVADVRVVSEVDDEFIFPGEIQPQLAGRPALTILTNKIACALLHTHQALSSNSAEAFGVIIPDAFDDVKNFLSDDEDGSLGLAAPFSAEPDLDAFLDDERRRRVRFDVLRADLRITVFACRARMLDHAYSLEGVDEGWQQGARESFFGELALFLKGLPVWVIEPHSILLVSFLVPVYVLAADRWEADSPSCCRRRCCHRRRYQCGRQAVCFVSTPRARGAGRLSFRVIYDTAAYVDSAADY
jgi:hypothetical protein